MKRDDNGSVSRELEFEGVDIGVTPTQNGQDGPVRRKANEARAMHITALLDAVRGLKSRRVYSKGVSG